MTAPVAAGAHFQEGMMENNEMEVTKEDIRAAAYYWVGSKGRETSQDDLTYFYANWAALSGMEYLVEAFARHRTTALAAALAKVEKLREALAEQVGECFDERCEMCLRHEALLAETQPDERTQP